MALSTIADGTKIGRGRRSSTMTNGATADNSGVRIMSRAGAGKGRMAGSAIRETGVCHGIGRPGREGRERQKTEQHGPKFVMANPDTMHHACTPEWIFSNFLITHPLDFLFVGVNLNCVIIAPLSKRRFLQ